MASGSVRAKWRPTTISPGYAMPDCGHRFVIELLRCQKTSLVVDSRVYCSPFLAQLYANNSASGVLQDWRHSRRGCLKYGSIC